jgi:cytochrome P450
MNPIDAVTHADPYPYYAQLAQNSPLYFDDALQMWIATSADAVAAVLASERCRVRPLDEPVPRALAGSAAGDVFRRLVRMTDGAGHCPLKQAISATLDSLQPDDIRAVAERCARAFATPHDLMFSLPVTVVGTLLGLPDDALPQLPSLVAELVACFAPGAAADTRARGNAAAETLATLLRRALPHAGEQTLLATLARNAARFGDDVVIANAIGFLTQSYDATAGLIGNALLAGEQRSVDDVLRFDAPVQNTRRFVAEDGDVAGVAMRRGDVILVVLAAASDDAQRTFSFGSGAHACPARMLATTIAAAALARLRWSGTARGYRPSTNARVPVL